ncbi:iron-sulfur cluster carrier protein ApbC [Pusillimonas caeni]|uniref:iron-sulfur cluster carrier protein ApbC n=1 Tax=Pusillimonas caeni TaxID=1348472 RepID=UPI000E59E9D6|nr:iron-sulfur cluster carrier protein ApbC [Pusillimonas caeni]TFL15270.1 iron-sulfur cluster carrier protein ApbC [Pusillimonas caeni]
MSPTSERVSAALAEVVDPATKRKLGPATIKNSTVQLDGSNLSLTVALDYPLYNDPAELRKQLETAVEALGVTLSSLQFTTRIQTHAVQPGLKPLPTVRNIIAVASGKGGVGKSTTSVNLALALSAQGASVGLLDADIYGPSVPIMLGVSGKPKSLDNKSMEPLEGHGLQANSIGFLIDQDAPAIWRGPMVSQALEQLLRQTNWRDLDYLIIDMPPGTGDIALTLSQKVPLAGAVIVTTPQDLALADARKGLRMFQKVDVPVLGIVENMSVHVCSNCGHAEPIFGEHGGRDMAAEYHLPWLGALPLAMDIRLQTDSGKPTVVADPEGPVARLYLDIAHKVALQVAALPRDFSARMPTVVARH